MSVWDYGFLFWRLGFCETDFAGHPIGFLQLCVLPGGLVINTFNNQIILSSALLLLTATQIKCIKMILCCGRLTPMLNDLRHERQAGEVDKCWKFP